MNGIEEWAAFWSLLCERFNTDKSEELCAFYYAALSAHLTPEQIRAGASKVLVSGRFFPSPDEIMAAAGMSSGASALAEWDLCYSAMEGSDKAYDRLSETGKKMVRLLGGLQALRNCNLDSVPFIRKEWLKLYADASEIDAHERQMLAPMSAEGRKMIAAAMAGEPMPESEDAA